MRAASYGVQRSPSGHSLLLTIGFLLASVSASAFDYDADNGAATVLFQMGGSARGQGMGGAYASLCRGSESAYWNPGGLAYQEYRFEVQISPRFFQSVDYELGDDERSYLMAQGGVRIGKFAFAATGVISGGKRH